MRKCCEMLNNKIPEITKVIISYSQFLVMLDVSRMKKIKKGNKKK